MLCLLIANTEYTEVVWIDWVRSWVLKWASNSVQLTQTTLAKAVDDNLELDLWENQAAFRW